MDGGSAKTRSCLCVLLGPKKHDNRCRRKKNAEDGIAVGFLNAPFFSDENITPLQQHTLSERFPLNMCYLEYHIIVYLYTIVYCIQLFVLFVYLLY